MNSGYNFSFEEYKLLKEESKIFTNQTFRDFQLFIGLIAIFFASISSKDFNLPKFASYTFMQLSVFIFIVIQFSRVVYLLIIRQHLFDLEKKLNQTSSSSNILEWESKVVPKKIAPLISYMTINQIAIGVIYFLIFLFLCAKSVSHSYSIKKEDLVVPIWSYYFIVLPIEALFIIISLISVYTHRNNHKKIISN